MPAGGSGGAGFPAAIRAAGRRHITLATKRLRRVRTKCPKSEDTLRSPTSASMSAIGGTQLTTACVCVCVRVSVCVCVCARECVCVCVCA